ncbi:UDP-N-acetylglucosamine 2-epimerase (hydrolyzing) [Flavobacterium aquidurense]|uniref:UDP-N-acetylglucosamine 2-epimerase n=1 Tax=Flavobacterium aquidurense TaxID=362413 RepID=UPI0009117D30|nr:UDP-N-acetylglucosamine 2-epimerase [Flavobacterium aquidurense]OXA71457.1 UDP-N-acetylglucosamine 2-epimerase (hydrolyzing) [Flavobacterium aquidurense]SHG94746.1 GDP/UDP-N,N'-diacetylbacillosamine 2-epimerase (hydrolysing) [Flavobacterium frigidimaris]
MKLGVLTSSRADYGIYLPLLNKIKNDEFFDLEIIAFGTHLSRSHGYTLKDIKRDNYNCIHEISCLISNDSEESTASSYGLTVLKFADFWQIHKYDLVFCLGDRFEMSAAIQAGIPFGVKFAHLHGGETTLGAIDNIYRHQITLASTLHFTATDIFAEKVSNLIDSSKNVFTTGSLSLNDIKSFTPLKKQTFFEKFGIPEENFILVTFHPETMSAQDNFQYAEEMKKALKKIAENRYIVITMPNADTQGSIYREAIEKLKVQVPDRVLLIENFGKSNYFSAMYYASILLGNTSSGILEAASFGKYFVNVGDRQKGRAQSRNVINCEFEEKVIVSSVVKAIESNFYTGENIYFRLNAADNIIKIIKQFS